MKIPTRVRVGRRTYAIKTVPSLGYRRGLWRLHQREILLAMRSGVSHTGYKPRERAETFWHEITHAILHDMKHPLWKNERFVEQFSARLNSAIHSAQFD